MFPGIFVQEKSIAFVAGQRVNEELSVDEFITSLQPGIDSGIASTVDLVGVPFFRIANGPVGEVIVGAHDRAPEVTSQVDFRGQFLGRREISAEGVDIEISVIVEIDKLASPGPSGFSNEE